MSWMIRYPLLALVWLGGSVGIHSEGGCKWWVALTMMGIVVVFALIRSADPTTGQQEKP